MSHHHPWVAMPALLHCSDTFITVGASLSFTVRIGWSISQSKCQTFSCLFLSLFYVDTATAWSNDSLFLFSHLFFSQMDPALLPVFFSSPFYPTYLPSFILLICFFWGQQIGIDQGDIPDLSQVSVHLTSLSLFLLSSNFSYILFPSHLFSTLSTTCGFIASSVL